ncbi:MAG TPA: glycosyltransferase family 4 protein [Candidatus Atribacteria bacterium]|nr:glycosyltransferase family 4 protein [Candidatus Atribacteria bacterium]
MKFKNLLIISNRFPDKKDMFIGGIFVKEQLNYIRKYFKEVTVISPVPRSLGLKEDDKYCRDYSYENVKVYFPRFSHLPVVYFRNRLGDNYFKAINRLIKKKNIKFDLIHAHFAWPSGYAGAKLKEKYKKPLIITAHGYDIYDLPFRNEFWQNKIKYILNSADFIITISNKNLQFIRKLNVETPTKVIPNGYNSNLFYPFSKDLAKKKLNLSLNKKIILTVGNLVEVKGHKYLIQAMREILKQRKDVMCIIVGSGELKKGLEKLVKDLNLQGHIKLVGGKSHKEVPLWMNACDVFVLPSLKESFGIVQIEAMACGKPIVATYNGGSEEIIKEKTGILVEPRNPKQLKEALNKALDKEWNGQKIVEYSKKFTWEEIVNLINGIYEELLNEKD